MAYRGNKRFRSGRARRYSSPAAGNGAGIFLNGSFGGAAHNGYLDDAPPGRKNPGSRILFRESLELGYRANPVVGVSAILDHISNANLASHNTGITSAGARIGFRF